MIITIDGPVAAGKTSAARRLADRIGFIVLDTGAIYRAVALESQRAGADWLDEPVVAGIAGQLDIQFRSSDGIECIEVAGREVTDAIREPQISRGASVVSAHPGVRQALLSLQRAYGAAHDVIAEGRDVGTVVFPDAECKFFLTATPEVRARRRHLQLQQKGIEKGLDAVLRELQERDHRDSNRAVAPLVPAADAVHIDSSTMNLDQVIDQLWQHLPVPIRGAL